MSNLMLDVDQAGELKAAFRRGVARKWQDKSLSTFLRSSKIILDSPANERRIGRSPIFPCALRLSRFRTRLEELAEVAVCVLPDLRCPGNR